MKSKSRKLATLLTHAGRDPAANFGIVNPPIYRASTVLQPTVAALEAAQRDRYGGVRYGRFGTPTTFALEEAAAAVEGGHRAVALPSGLAAVAAALLGFVRPGDHVLMADHVYGPARNLANGMLKRFGVETEFYDPMIGAGIAALFRDKTRLVYMESPGSLTFEVMDVPAVLSATKPRGIATILDNTWASPCFFHPLKLGVDVSVVAATKYIVGHSDAMLGLAICNEASFMPIRLAASELGYSAGPDDCYLGLRGLRQRPEVARVLHPALPGNPGHEAWRRDFTGASGLFGVVLRDVPKPAVAAMLDGMELFGMGASWGGYESLILPTHPEKLRTATRWQPEGPTLRLHAGLEDLGDLVDDLERGLARLRAAAG